ncbi:unnamed protein product, partial [Rotaria sp. Silwood2]
MAQSEVDQTGIDDSLPNSLLRIPSGCVNTTITPGACGGNSGSCTLTFYRTSTFLGITLSNVDGYTTGVIGFSVIPTSVRFSTQCLYSNGTTLALVCPYGANIITNNIHAAPSILITGIAATIFYQSRISSTFTTFPITGRSTITFGVHYDPVNRNSSVNLA